MPSLLPLTLLLIVNKKVHSSAISKTFKENFYTIITINSPGFLLLLRFYTRLYIWIFSCAIHSQDITRDFVFYIYKINLCNNELCYHLLLLFLCVLKSTENSFHDKFTLYTVSDKKEKTKECTTTFAVPVYYALNSSTRRLQYIHRNSQCEMNKKLCSTTYN